MSEDPKRYQDHTDSSKCLRQIEDIYVYDPSSRLYKPKTTTHNDEAKQSVQTNFYDQPIRVRAITRTETDWIMFGLTLVGILVSCLTLALLLLTVNYARKQWHEMEAQSKNSTDALTETKNANTKNSTDNLRAYQLSRESLENVQRAFVYAEGVISPVPSENGTIDSFQLASKWTNSGETPTKNLTQHVSTSFYAELPANFTYPELWSGGATHKNPPTYIAPKGSIASTSRVVLTKQHLEAMLAGNIKFFMWGETNYEDVFSHTKKHVTKFCFIFFATKEAVTVPTDTRIGIGSEDCKSHNCHDEECKTQN